MEVSGVNMYSAKKIEPPKQELDRDAFLKILVAEMRYQNPLNPQGGNQFISQMVELSTMEQIFTLVKDMETLLRAQELSLSAGLLGKRVVAEGRDGKDVQGAVEKVVVDKDGIRLVINGAVYSYEALKGVLG